MNKANIELIYGLSPIQQGMLFHSLYEPGADVYFEQFSWSFREAIDIQLFARAWQYVVQQHPILRTSFHWEELDEPLQVVHRRVQMPIEQYDWRRLSAEEQAARLEAFLKADRRSGFELSKAPLLRLALIRMDEQEYQVVWSYHHLLVDGWSAPLIRGDFLAAYDALRSDRSVSLKARPPYRQYINWLQQQDLSGAEAFWRQALKGFTTPTPIYAEPPDPAARGQGDDYAARQIVLAEAATEGLQALARQLRLTLNTLVLGAWALLLSHYSGQEDVVYGATVSGRPPELPGSESMIGVFINTLPMRVRVDPQAALGPWLQQLQKQQFEWRQFEYTPLAEIQRWSDGEPGVPLFKSIVVFENFPSDAAESRRNIRVFQRTNYPLTLVAEPGAQLLLRLSYQRREFSDAAIERILLHLQTIMEHLADHAAARLIDVPLMSAAEQQRVLVAWNATVSGVAGQGPGVGSAPAGSWCLHQLIEAQVARTPDTVAIVFDRPSQRQGDKETRRHGDTETRSPTPNTQHPTPNTQHLTYRELNERANRLAHHLRALGIRPEVRVGIMVERSPEMLVGLLGILKAGGAYVPLDPDFPQERLQFMLDDSQPAVVLTTTDDRRPTTDDRRPTTDDRPPTTDDRRPTTDHRRPTTDHRPTTTGEIDTETRRHGDTEIESADNVTPSPLHPFTLSHQSVVDLRADWPSIAQASVENLYSGVRADNLAYVLYTSGSTGRPKGVQISHRALVNFLATMGRKPGIDARDRLLAVTTLSFDIAGLELYLPLTAGACVEVLNRAKAGDGLQLAERLAASDVTMMQATPATWRMLLAGGWRGSAGLRILCGGEALPRDLANQLVARSAETWNMYGPTETTIWSTTQRVTAGEEPIAIGRPIGNTQVYLLDRLGRPVPIGVPGELYIGGDGLARGYLGRPDLTAAAFVPNPFGDKETRRQGDKETGNDEASTQNLKLKTQNLRLYRTGDLARYRADGTIECLGRIDQQVKVRGFRIELGEIETRLSQHPAVRAAVAHVWEDEPGDKRLVAYVVPTNDQRPMTNEASADDTNGSSFVVRRSSFVGELRAFLQEQLPDYMIPSAFVVLEQLPLTPNGKIDRRALPRADTVRPAAGEELAPPTTQIEAQLADLWSRLLGVKEVGIHDNFFALGGDSIRSLQLIAKANQVGLRFTPDQLFQYPTIARLATVISRNQALQTQQDPVIGAVPLTPIQRWFFEAAGPEPWHWNQSLALELLQPLDPALLEQAVLHLLRHHDALRLRFADGGRYATSAPPDGSSPFQRYDLSALAPEAQDEALRAAATAAQTSLNLADGPLLRVTWIDRGQTRPSILLIVIHHLAVDGISWSILLDDLQSVYTQLQQGAPVTLPLKTSSFQQWAAQLQSYAQTERAQAEALYWRTLARPPLAQLPLDTPDDHAENTETSARSLTVTLSAEETRALLEEVPRAYQTQLHEVLLAALAQTLAPGGALLIDLEGLGREDLFAGIDLSRTVGWFTTRYPVRLDLSGTVGQGEVLKTIKEQLRAVPQHGIGYGILRYLSEDAALADELRTQPPAEVSFTSLGRLDQVLPPTAPFRLEQAWQGPRRSLQAPRRYALEINSRIAQEQLQVEWIYSAYAHATVEHLAAAHLSALRDLIDHCLAPDAGGYTPSDVAEFEWDQGDIDHITRVIGKKGRAVARADV